MNRRCNRGKASLDTLVSRKTEKSSSCNLQILWHTAANLCRSSERACGIDLHDEAWRRHGDQRQQKRCRRGDSWCHFDTMDGKWRSLQNIHWHFLSLTAGCHQGASSKHHRRHVSAYAWRFAGTSTHKLQASVECEHGAVPVRPNLPGPGLHSALIPHSSSIPHP